MRWAGLADVPFALVTGAELMRWTKPHPGYYRQILALTGRRPEQCLMVGDDPRMDMAAKEAGIATWLAERDGDAPRRGAARRPPGDARAARGLAAEPGPPLLQQPGAVAQDLLRRFPPGSSAVSEALKTT